MKIIEKGFKTGKRQENIGKKTEKVNKKDKMFEKHEAKVKKITINIGKGCGGVNKS